MARKKRIIYPGFCHHVMIRGVGGRNIFADDKDRARFCLLLQYASQTCKFTVHGFCFMNNHVHMILQPHTQDLSSGMHRLTFRYAQYFNKKLERKGYLFQGRYKAIVVQKGTYLRRLIRYIHLNPIRANLVNNISGYPWSSHQAYIGASEFTWLKTDLVLSLFGSESRDALGSFQRYVSTDDSEAKIELEEIRKSMELGAYGNDAFVREFQGLLETDSDISLGTNLQQDNQDLSLKKHTEISLEMVVNALLSKVTATALEELQAVCRKVQLVEARAVLVWLTLHLKAGSKRELANLLHRDLTSIARLEQRVQQSPKLREFANKIATEILLT